MTWPFSLGLLFATVVLLGVLAMYERAAYCRRRYLKGLGVKWPWVRRASAELPAGALANHELAQAIAHEACRLLYEACPYGIGPDEAERSVVREVGKKRFVWESGGLGKHIITFETKQDGDRVVVTKPLRGQEVLIFLSMAGFSVAGRWPASIILLIAVVYAFTDISCASAFAAFSTRKAADISLATLRITASGAGHLCGGAQNNAGSNR